MSEIMETASDDRHRAKNKLKLTPFPDYVRKVQQLSFSQTAGTVTTTSTTTSEEKTLPSGIKRQNLSRAFSCFSTSSNSPNLPCKTPDTVKHSRLPPLHACRRRQQTKKLQLKSSAVQENGSLFNNSTSSSQQPSQRPIAFDHLRTQEASIHRASSFPFTNTDCPDSKAVAKPKWQMSKSPYLQPLARKSYYQKEANSCDKSPKGSRKKRVVKQQKLNTTDNPIAVDTVHEVSEGEQNDNSLQIPSITLRAATPLANSDDMSTSLSDQFTARQQLAAELEKLNREIQNIVVSVEQVVQ